MKNFFCKYPLYKCTKTLALVATGKIKAELVIKNAKLINVCTKEIIDNVSVAVAMGRIAKVGNCDSLIGENTKVIDLQGKYLAPSFLDGHIHIESSMITPSEYAKAVIPHGTSGVFIDPHEICNVLGTKGIDYMLKDAKSTPLKTYLTMPSCVPAVVGFEDTGARIDAKHIKKAMKKPECVGLGEMMNFPGILNADEHTHQIVEQTLKADKVITGHYSLPETDGGLNGYVATGARCCHESTRKEDALSKMRLGMYAQFREGSAWKDLHHLAKVLTEEKVDSRFSCLVSDDNHPNTLKNQGHLDHIVARAIEEGIDPITAIQMVTINTATSFDLAHEIGSIAPSKCADMVVISDLNACKVDMVIIDGEVVSENGKLVKDFVKYNFPKKAKNTVKLNPIKSQDLSIKCNGKSAKVNVIEIIPARVGTYRRIEKLEVINGELKSNLEKDILKAVVFERHKKTKTKGFGFVKGFNIKSGALAQTVAHDAHNLFVIGTNDEDMALAVNILIKCGGGMVAVDNGKILGLAPLSIAGLMSDKPLEQTQKDVESVEKAWVQMGCKHISPFMTMAIIPLACLPEIRLTNRGLVDCTKFEFVDLIEEIYN